MKKNWQIFILLILVTCLSIIMQPGYHFSQQIIGKKVQIPLEKVMAQQLFKTEEKNSTNIQEQVTSDNDKLGAPVIVNGETIFYLKNKLHNVPPEERALQLVDRIKRIADDHSESIDSISADKLSNNIYLIVSDQRIILIVTDIDAKAANQTLDQLASEHANKIKEAITKYRQNNSFIHIVKSIFYTILSIAAFILVVRLLNWVHEMVNNFFTNWLHQRLDYDSNSISTFWEWLKVIGLDVYRLFHILHNIVYWIVILGATYVFIPLILSFFPLTQELSNTIIAGLTRIFENFWSNFLDYLPNLLIILIAITIVYFLDKYAERFCLAIANGTIVLSGFYPDWGKPTYKLFRFILFALMLALIYPYLPGSNTASFQGVSIFVGALVTVGGAGALGNIVGGFIIIYTRAYQIGDRIKIAGIKGDVVEKTVLSTRICTLDNEIVTIPNSTVLASNIINYSAAKRDFQRSLILRTTITLGYDVPWRKVYKALLSAANSTEKILKEPAPIVLQASLDDFYVSYHLKAHTDYPLAMVEIYSALHENIQDKCNEVGIEIMSPHYSALRDGNQNTIPEDYLPKDYNTPGFRVNSVGKIFNQPSNLDNERELSGDGE